jgi:hypothetical protein
MITCEECGCLVDPSEEMLQRHSDWHDELVTKEDLTSSALANRHRTKLNINP